MVAQLAESAAKRASHERNAEFTSDLGIDVLEPIDQARFLLQGHLHGNNRGKGRVGFRNQNIAWPG